jgi:hypothetical protein
VSYLANLAEQQLGDPSRFREIADRNAVNLFKGIETSLIGEFKELGLPAEYTYSISRYKAQALGDLQREGGAFDQLVVKVAEVKSVVQEFTVNWFI